MARNPKGRALGIDPRKKRARKTGGSGKNEAEGRKRQRVSPFLPFLILNFSLFISIDLHWDRMRERNLMFSEDIDAPEVFRDENTLNSDGEGEMEEEDIGEDPYWHLTPEDIKKNMGASLLMNKSNATAFSKSKIE